MRSDLDKILEVGESFFQVQEAEELLKLILAQAKGLCHAERSTLFIRGKENKKGEVFLQSYMATAIGGDLNEIKVSAKIGIVGLTFATGEAQIVNNVKDHPHFNPRIDERTHFETASILSVPLMDGPGHVLGVLQVLNKYDGDFSAMDLREVKLLSLFAVMALRRIEDKQKISQIKKHFGEESRNSIESVSLKTNCFTLESMYEKLRLVSESSSSVLLLGESGTGKEVTARYIHAHSHRAHAPFVVVNCAAIPPSLFEAELFGIKGGVATDVHEREGVFQQADGGTLFLDEIGELPIELQSKLLRVLQEKKVVRVGETKERSIDIRLISATNRDLEKEAKKNERFREDLFFRINVFQFKLPPLRERLEDIHFLAEDLMSYISKEQKIINKKISPEAFAKLNAYQWPGNIRELKNVLERACVLAKHNDEITAQEILLPEVNQKLVGRNSLTDTQVIRLSDMSSQTKKFQKEYALKVVDHFEGNKSKAAESLKISREGLRKILKREVA